jgi:hypothetical protein
MIMANEKLTLDEFATIKAQYLRLVNEWPDGAWEARSSATTLDRVFFELAPESVQDSILDCSHQPTAEFLVLVLNNFGKILDAVKVD